MSMMMASLVGVLTSIVRVGIVRMSIVKMSIIRTRVVRMSLTRMSIVHPASCVLHRALMQYAESATPVSCGPA